MEYDLFVKVLSWKISPTSIIMNKKKTFVTNVPTSQGTFNLKLSFWGPLRKIFHVYYFS